MAKAKRKDHEPMNAETPTDEAPVNASGVTEQEITIQDIVFRIPSPYHDGYTINAAEAAALNQTYAENLRNNFAKSVKQAKEAGAEVDVAELQAQLTAYAETYEFQGRRRSVATPVDPVGKEAHKIAKSMVTEALQKKGIKIKDLPEGKLESLIEDLLAKNPAIREEAERRVEATKAATVDLFDSLDLD